MRKPEKVNCGLEPLGDTALEGASDKKFVIEFNRHDVEPILPPRPLSGWEQAVIDRILSTPFQGCGAALQQLSTARVEASCSHCPSVWLTVERDPAHLITDGSEPLQGIAPCELHGFDRDGMPVQILLHVDEGFMTELDVFRGDGAGFLELPEPSALELVCE